MISEDANNDASGYDLGVAIKSNVLLLLHSLVFLIYFLSSVFNLKILRGMITER